MKNGLESSSAHVDRGSTKRSKANMFAFTQGFERDEVNEMYEKSAFSQFESVHRSNFTLNNGKVSNYSIRNLNRFNIFVINTDLADFRCLAS